MLRYVPDLNDGYIKPARKVTARRFNAMENLPVKQPWIVPGLFYRLKAHLEVT
jgi:hypothetical protein